MKYFYPIALLICLISGNGFSQTEPADTNTLKKGVVPVQNDDTAIVVDYEVLPEFPGGLDSLFVYLSHTVKYPPKAVDAGIEGTVYVQFVVEKDGTITRVKIRRGVHDLLDYEAVKAVKGMPPWKPGFQKGKPVRTEFMLPVKFQLKTGRGEGFFQRIFRRKSSEE